MADGIAPVAVAGAAADGADLELVVAARGEAVDGHVARVGEQAAVLHGWMPTSGRTPIAMLAPMGSGG